MIHDQNGPWNVFSAFVLPQQQELWNGFSSGGGTLLSPPQTWDLTHGQALDVSAPTLRWARTAQPDGLRLRLSVDALSGLRRPHSLELARAQARAGEVVWNTGLWALGEDGGGLREPLTQTGPLTAQFTLEVQRPLSWSATELHTPLPLPVDLTLFAHLESELRRFPGGENLVLGARSGAAPFAGGRGQVIDACELAVYSFWTYRPRTTSRLNALYQTALGGLGGPLGSGLGEQRFWTLAPGQPLTEGGEALPTWAKVLPLLGAAARCVAGETEVLRPAFSAQRHLEALDAAGDPRGAGFVQLAWLTLGALSGEDSVLPSALRVTVPGGLGGQLARLGGSALSLINAVGREGVGGDFGPAVQAALLLLGLDRLGPLTTVATQTVEDAAVRALSHPRVLAALLAGVRDSRLPAAVGAACLLLMEFLDQRDVAYIEADCCYVSEVAEARFAAHRTVLGEAHKPLLRARPDAASPGFGQLLSELRAALTGPLSGVTPLGVDFVATLLYYGHDFTFNRSSPKTAAFKVRVTA